jgi:proline iminopeptidase
VPTREGTFLSADGIQLFYRLAGDGQNVIVFLHGGPGLGIDDGGYDLEPLAARGHSLLMLNERGAGRSQVITEEAKLGIDSYVSDLETLRTTFRLGRLSLIGLSWGSAIVATYAATHPDRVERLALISPMPVTWESGQQRSAHLMSMLRRDDAERMRQVDGLWESVVDEELVTLCRDSLVPVLKLYVVNPENLNRTRGNVCGYSPEALRNRDRVASATVSSLGNWDFRPMLRTIKAPTVVIEGEKTNAPLDDVRQWAESIPNAELLLIPNAGHMNWLDQPDAVLDALDRFFNRIH